MVKRTFSNGQALHREKGFMSVRTRYENLQRRCRKGGARRDIGRVYVVSAGHEKFARKRNYPLGARGPSVT